MYDPNDFPAVPNDPSSGQKSALLSLWVSPWTGVSLFMFFVTLIHEQGPGRAHKMFTVLLICNLIWLGGIALSVFALAGTRTRGRKGIFGRALAGLFFNGLLLLAGLAMTFYGFASLRDLGGMRTTKPDQFSELNEGQKALIEHAEFDFAAKMHEMQVTYAELSKEFTNRPILDMSGIRSKQDLQGREEKIQELVAVNNKLRTLVKNAPDLFDAELAKKDVNPEIRRLLLDKLRGYISQFTPAIEQLRVADDRRMDCYSREFKLLEENWGRWKWREEKPHMVFSDENLQKQSNKTIHEINTLYQEEFKLRRQLNFPVAD